MNESLFFIIFVAVIVLLLLLDLGLFNKTKHVLSFKEASMWVILWVGLALGFYFFIIFFGEMIHDIHSYDQLKEIVARHHHPIVLDGNNFDVDIEKYRHNLGLEYISGYLIEYALSVDNLFVMMLIFMSFKVPEKLYKEVLFWGILGAIVMRFVFIFTSSALIHRFEWILYVFGVFLVFTGVKMLMKKNDNENMDIEKHPVVRIASKYFKVFPRFVGDHFFIRKNAKLYITPLLLVVFVIEFSDVLFAVDSIPAIFSVTKDPEIVFFSNIFAILGLRSLFFMLSHVMNMFRFLKPGLAILLAVIGLKMLFEHQLKTIGFTTLHSLLMIIAILAGAILLSILIPEKKQSK